ncbi:autotransporter domain-containing protein [Sebaldella sp. S0638]|uniref:autotransporter domain-containing protein n=1 Tax=Sebaldella sp. S0638 TaxID=2957809 RepID=UPI0020A0DC4E|nr:autotransporter domain-containing protein [Sebaldella sp. S0638]
MKDKKMLFFLALNAASTLFADTNKMETAKNGRLYQNMLKNINVNKSNEKNYKLIERILEQKNKELKNLYSQGDYIVKPEYLEWQIFFSGFYNEKQRGDNTMENALYYSNPKTSGDSNKINREIYESIIKSGISDDILYSILNGNKELYSGLTADQKILVDKLFSGDQYATEGDFKPYHRDNDYKVVDLGLSIDVKGVDREVSDIKVSDINIPNIQSNIVEVFAPDELDIPVLDIVSFNPSIPNITTINFNPIPILNLNGTGGGNGGVTGFFPAGDTNGGNSIISQMDLTSGTINVRTQSNDDWSPNNPGFYEYTLDNVVGAPSAGLKYDMRQIYDPITGMWDEELAVLPTGIYTDSILNYKDIYGMQVQGVFKVVDNPITRFGVAGGNPEDLRVTLEGDVVDADYLVQILHYDEHYMGYDPETGEMLRYTLTDMENNGWITAGEKQELADKFLDTSLGHTVDNRWFQYVENNGTWELKGSNVVAVNLQAHGAYEPANSYFTNRGTIVGLNEASTVNNLLGKQVAFMFTEGDAYNKQEGFDNTGKVEMRAPESVIFLMTNNASSGYFMEELGSDGEHSEYKGDGKHVMMNNGDMKLYGNSSVGFYTNNAVYSYYSYGIDYNEDGSWKWYESGNGLFNSELQLYKPITVLGDQSIGLDLERNINFENSKLKVDVGTEDPRQAVANSAGYNGLENSGNISGGDSSYTENSVGAYINLTHEKNNSTYSINDCRSGTCIYVTENKARPVVMNDYYFNVGEYSRGGAAVRVEEHADVTLGSSQDSTKSNTINLLAGGENNAGIYISGAEAVVKTNGLILNIDGKAQVGSQVENDGEFFHNNGVINVNGVNNTGVAVRSSGTGELNNNAVINVGMSNLGVYNEGTFNMNGGSIVSNGLASVGIYSEAGNTDTNLKGGSIRAENGGIGLYAGNSSVINLHEGVSLSSGNKGLLFYNYDNSTVSGKYDITGTVDASVENGGSAFYVKEGSSITDYLNNSFTGSGKLELTMGSGSKLYILEGTGTTLSLSSLDGMVNPGSSLTSNVVISSASASDYIPLSMNKGALILDRNINLDSNNELYKRSEFSSVKVDLTSGNSITGSQAGQIGIAQRNYENSSGQDAVKITNDGAIILTGNNATGIASDYGHVINNSTVKTTGDKSVAIYSTNGTTTENNGEIIIGGNSSAGIYGANYLDGINSSAVLKYGNDKIDISNNNRIVSEGNGKVYGIYADNKYMSRNDSVITLGSGSDINLSSSNGGVGIYSNNSVLTGEGSLSVGNSGVGIYAKDSDVNLNNFMLNLNGDKALGFYLDGNTNFAGNGNININGKDILVFNINSNGTFTNDFVINSASGSSYTLGNVINNTFRYTGNASLAGNGSFIYGKNSAVLLDAGSVISASEDNVVGISMEGQYNGSLPSGFTSGVDGENKGNITLAGNNSAGIYAKDSSRVKNSGNISVGNSSVGISTKGAGSTAVNSGTVSIGELSTGIYGSESNLAENTADGKILSNAAETAGIYMDGSTAAQVINNGLIELNGDKSRGIYVKGNGAKTVTNTGTVKIGNSSDINNPGIGIYSAGSGNTVINSGNILTGANSVGIYAEGGMINQSGIISTGDSGTGIYADGANIVLNSGSEINTGNNKAVGVYALNGTNIVNNGKLTAGENSYGYVLKSGSGIENNFEVTLKNNSVFVYGDSAGNIKNNAGIIMNGSDITGFYAVNGGNIENNGNINGVAGTANIGIYSQNGTVRNTGEIILGDSVINDFMDTKKNRYTVGIFGENSNVYNSGNVKVGYYGIGVYGSGGHVENHGNITSDAEGAIGLFIEKGTLENFGDITLNGENSIGIYANKLSTVTNHGIITMNGESSQGVYLNIGSVLENNGVININAGKSQGILIKGGGDLVNNTGGIINLGAGAGGSETVSYGSTSDYLIPSIINGGIINVSENFELNGIDIVVL